MTCKPIIEFLLWNDFVGTVEEWLFKGFIWHFTGQIREREFKIEEYRSRIFTAWKFPLNRYYIWVSGNWRVVNAV